MVESHTKNKLLMLEFMVAVVLLVFVGAFALDKVYPTAQVATETGTLPIVGFVPLEIKSQPIDLSSNGPSAFLLFSEKDDAFNLTSFRISGEVTGTGRAEIVLDNGLGQELLIYSNIKQKQGNLITGMAVDEAGEPLPDDAKIEQVQKESAWLMISADTKSTVEGPKTELGDNKRTEAGVFQHSCVDTCYMNMKMQKGLYYTLKIRVDAGTEAKINELKYMLEV
jgi:hypothetical protein